MRVVKALLGLSLTGAVVVIWTLRAPVVEAYTTERSPLELHFDGFEVAVQHEDLGPSPYRVASERPDLATADPGPVQPLVPDEFPPAMAGGAAQVRGRAYGPNGPVAGAVVVVERHTLSGFDQVTTSGDHTGSFAVEGLVGGRYRVRAYVPGSLGMDTTSVFFLAESQEVDVELVMRAARPGLVVDLVDGEPTLVDGDFTVAVSLGRESVDGQGRFVVTPAPGIPVDVGVTGTASLQSADRVLTDSAGSARFGFHCDAVGTTSMTATIGDLAAGTTPADPPAPAVGGVNHAFVLPPCVDALPDPETAGVPDSPTAGPLDD